MKNFNKNVLSAGDSLNTNGDQIDFGQVVSASFHAYFGDTNAAGTFKLQASNDVCITGNLPNFTVTNWIDIPNQSATITAGASALLTIAQNGYKWCRCTYTNTATGAQTVAPIADTGVRQVQTVSTVADVAGSLNSKYFLLSSLNKVTKAQKNFYLWLDDGAGVDPAIAGKTGIHITYTDGDSAATLATSIRSALNALTNDFVATGASAAVIITDVAPGPVTAAVDGTAATGFTFGAATSGVASNLNNKYFLLSGGGTSGIQYYVWLNVDGIGTDPAVASRTAVPVAIAASDTAATIGAAIATAVAAVHATADFTTSGTTTVTITNKVAGPFVPASAGTSGFTVVTTVGGSSTINVNMNVLSV